MDFSKAPRSISPHFPAKHGAPADEDGPAGADFSLTNPTLGPADTYAPTSPNPMSIIGPGAAMPSLAEMLNWRVPGDRKQRSA